MGKTRLCLVLGIALVFLGTGAAESDYELDSCINNCRVTFDPVKDEAGYADCVEDCKRKYSREEPRSQTVGRRTAAENPAGNCSLSFTGDRMRLAVY